MEKTFNYKRIGKKTEKKVKSIFQLLILGDCEVGKTSLIKRILYNEFNEEYNKTISFEFNWNNFEIENEIYTLQIWDITGKKNFNLISENFYKKCKCAFFIYSIDDKKSFLSLNERLNIQIDPEILKQYFIELKDKRKDIKWIYHNAKFDLGVLRTFLGVPMPDPYWDTLIGRTFIRARWRAFIKIFI